MDWYLAALHKYADFSGRSRRMEYWMFTLLNSIFGIGLAMIDVFVISGDHFRGIGILSGLYSLAMIVPTFSVFIRRLHDTGRSGWWFFLNLIPLIGAIVLLVFTCQDGEFGDNQYGPDPKLSFM